MKIVSNMVIASILLSTTTFADFAYANWYQYAFTMPSNIQSLFKNCHANITTPLAPHTNSALACYPNIASTEPEIISYISELEEQNNLLATKKIELDQQIKSHKKAKLNIAELDRRALFFSKRYGHKINFNKIKVANLMQENSANCALNFTKQVLRLKQTSSANFNTVAISSRYTEPSVLINLSPIAEPTDIGATKINANGIALILPYRNICLENDKLTEDLAEALDRWSKYQKNKLQNNGLNIMTYLAQDPGRIFLVNLNNLNSSPKEIGRINMIYRSGSKTYETSLSNAQNYDNISLERISASYAVLESQQFSNKSYFADNGVYFKANNKVQINNKIYDEDDFIANCGSKQKLSPSSYELNDLVLKKLRSVIARNRILDFITTLYSPHTQQNLSDTLILINAEGMKKELSLTPYQIVWDISRERFLNTDGSEPTPGAFENLHNVIREFKNEGFIIPSDTNTVCKDLNGTITLSSSAFIREGD